MMPLSAVGLTAAALLVAVWLSWEFCRRLDAHPSHAPAVDFRCRDIRTDSPLVPRLVRCESDDTVCYYAKAADSGGGLSCSAKLQPAYDGRLQ